MRYQLIGLSQNAITSASTSIIGLDAVYEWLTGDKGDG